jgi:hypothetical protein
MVSLGAVEKGSPNGRAFGMAVTTRCTVTTKT